MTKSSKKTLQKLAFAGHTLHTLHTLHTTGDVVEAGLLGVAAPASHLASRAVTAGLKESGHSAARQLVRASSDAALKQAAKKGAAAAAKTALRGNAIGALVGFVVDQGCDTVRLATGRIDGDAYVRKSAGNAAGAGGTLAGASAGAALGTLLCPGVGTVIGGFLGGIFGDLGARSVFD